MTRGDQRDRAREKAQKKQATVAKGATKSGASLQKRKEDDAAKLREKQAASELKRQAGTGGGGT